MNTEIPSPISPEEGRRKRSFSRRSRNVNRRRFSTRTCCISRTYPTKQLLVALTMLSASTRFQTTQAFAPTRDISPINTSFRTSILFRNIQLDHDGGVSSNSHGSNEPNEQNLRSIQGGRKSKVRNDSKSSTATTTNTSIQHFPSFDFDSKLEIINTMSTRSSLPRSELQSSSQEKMPSWLNPSAELAAEKLVALREVLQDADTSYFSQLETEQVISAIKQASEGDLKMVAGAVDFCMVLLETMEMSVATLIAAAFHYCDAYTARKVASFSDDFCHLDYWKQQKSEDNYGDSARAIRIGQDAHQLIKDAARIKRAEMIASESIKSRPSAMESANIRKMVLTETHDWRALAIRSAACLYRLRGIAQHFENQWLIHGHDSSSFSYSPHDLRVAREALAIHAPLASRLGMHRLKNEIEGAAFKILYRRQYDKVTELTRVDKSCKQDECSVTTLEDGMRFVLDKVTHEVELLLKQDEYFTQYVDQYKVTARIKESYSLWKKMKLKLKADHILEVPDALALRVVFDAKKQTPDEDDEVTRARERALCYYIRQTLTKRFKPLNDGRFKDYIANPKPNGYQSLHYTARTEFENDVWPFECQVRSGEMHHVAEFGLGAHWDYKAQQFDHEDETLSEEDAESYYAFKLDNSSDAYLRSVQEWHWLQAQGRHPWLASSSSTPLFERDPETTERLRARDEHLAPYLDALMKDQSNLSREHVFVFFSTEDDDGHVLELPNGACVLDALRESERAFGFTSSRMMEQNIIRNGSVTSVTQQLRNGDIITIPNVSNTSISK